MASLPFCCVKYTSQLAVIRKHAEGVLNLIIDVFHKDVKEHKSQYHRIIESKNGLGWKEPLRSFISNLPLDQVAQSHIQPGLQCLQGGGIHSLTGQPVPVSHHSHCKRCFSLYLTQIYLLKAQNYFPLFWHHTPC